MEKKALTLDEIEHQIALGTSLEGLLKQLNCSNVGEFKKLERGVVSNKRLTVLLKKLRANREKVNNKENYIEVIINGSSKLSENVLPMVYVSHNSNTRKVSGNTDSDDADTNNANSDNANTDNANPDNVDTGNANSDNVDTGNANSDNVDTDNANSDDVDTCNANTDNIDTDESPHETEKTNELQECSNCSNTSDFVIRSVETVILVGDNSIVVSNNSIGNHDNDVCGLEQDLSFYEEYASTISQKIAQLENDIRVHYNELSKMKNDLNKMLQEVTNKKKALEKCVEGCLLLDASMQKYKTEQKKVEDIISATKREIEKSKQTYLVFSTSDLQNTKLIGKKILYEDEMKQIVFSEFEKLFTQMCREHNLDNFKLSSIKKVAYIIAISNKYTGIKIVARDNDSIIELCKIMQVNLEIIISS